MEKYIDSDVELGEAGRYAWLEAISIGRGFTGGFCHLQKLLAQVADYVYVIGYCLLYKDFVNDVDNGAI